jgi:hypothetical protein
VSEKGFIYHPDRRTLIQRVEALFDYVGDTYNKHPQMEDIWKTMSSFFVLSKSHKHLADMEKLNISIRKNFENVLFKKVTERKAQILKRITEDLVGFEVAVQNLSSKSEYTAVKARLKIIEKDLLPESKPSLEKLIEHMRELSSAQKFLSSLELTSVENGCLSGDTKKIIAGLRAEVERSRERIGPLISFSQEHLAKDLKQDLAERIKVVKELPKTAEEHLQQVTGVDELAEQMSNYQDRYEFCEELRTLVVETGIELSSEGRKAADELKSIIKSTPVVLSETKRRIASNKNEISYVLNEIYNNLNLKMESFEKSYKRTYIIEFTKFLGEYAQVLSELDKKEEFLEEIKEMISKYAETSRKVVIEAGEDFSDSSLNQEENRLHMNAESKLGLLRFMHVSTQTIWKSAAEWFTIKKNLTSTQFVQLNVEEAIRKISEKKSAIAARPSEREISELWPLKSYILQDIISFEAQVSSGGFKCFPLLIYIDLLIPYQHLKDRGPKSSYMSKNCFRNHKLIYKNASLLFGGA